MEYTPRPIIFPLSNPTANCEAIPEAIYHWSDGQAIVATGSPFSDVEYNGHQYRIGQGNNVFIFPGIGLASIVSQTAKITQDMFTTASYALAECVSDEDIAKGCIYPRISALKAVSVHVAHSILAQMQATDACCHLRDQDLKQALAEHMWEPVYLPYRRV